MQVQKETSTVVTNYGIVKDNYSSVVHICDEIIYTITKPQGDEVNITNDHTEKPNGHSQDPIPRKRII